MMATAIPYSISWVLTYGEVCSSVFNTVSLTMTKTNFFNLAVGSFDSICKVSERYQSLHTSISLSTSCSQHCALSVLGPAEVAAWGLLGYVWDAFEEVTCTSSAIVYSSFFTRSPLTLLSSAGLASAAEVRVGYHMGAGQPHSGKIVAYKTVCWLAVQITYRLPWPQLCSCDQKFAGLYGNYYFYFFRFDYVHFGR